jgi:hypothetical protein
MGHPLVVATTFDAYGHSMFCMNQYNITARYGIYEHVLPLLLTMM